MKVTSEKNFINDNLLASDDLNKNDFELPVEIWNHIFKQLNTKDRKSFANVSKQFREIAIKNQQIENKEFLNFFDEKKIDPIGGTDELRIINDNNVNSLHFKKLNRSFEKQLYHLVKNRIIVTCLIKKYDFFLFSKSLKTDFEKQFPFNPLNKIFDAISYHKSHPFHIKIIKKIILYEEKFDELFLRNLDGLISANPLDGKKVEEMLKLLFLYGNSCSFFHKPFGRGYPLTNCHISMSIYYLGKFVSRKKSINERCRELFSKAVSKIDKQTLNVIRGNAEEYNFLIRGLQSISKVNKEILNTPFENSQEYNFLISELGFISDFKRMLNKLIPKNIEDSSRLLVALVLMCCLYDLFKLLKFLIKLGNSTSIGKPLS